MTNANRSRLSHDLVGATAMEVEADLLIITDPNRIEAARHVWTADIAGDVAIRSYSNRCPWQLHHREEGILAITLAEFLLVAGYISPNIVLEDFKTYIDRLTIIIIQAPIRVILMGDFNCKAIIAGSQYTNNRGQIFTNMMMATGLICLNDGTHTFEARGHRAVLDLSLVDSRWDAHTFHWCVLESDTGSDHRATLLVMDNSQSPAHASSKPPRLNGWQIDTVVNRTAAKLINSNELTPLVLQNIITEETTRIHQSVNRKHPVYWWSPEIALQRNRLQYWRRKKYRLRAGGGPPFEAALNEFAAARRELNCMIKRAKRDRWRELCSELASDP
ncbi:uncharacterized protein LOC142319981 [Lycorma delicatula]|uniref:uncharacterized protein LOC142319981 n=1 Tax=Lycorma delicatula TaxID=130591 RepID=UPI003F515278